MKRFLYRALIALHPPSFRERFGEEMMSIFDEPATKRDGTLFADAFVSLGWQWLMRSDLWKLAAGALVSTLILCGWGYSFAQSVNRSLDRSLQVMAGNPLFFQPHTSLNEQEFEREAAQAVAILAQIRKAERAKHAAPDQENPERGKAHPSQGGSGLVSNSPNKG